MNPGDLRPEERAELVRKLLADPEAQRRATQRYVDGLVEDARSLV
jgi:putative ubiquitin-RnfH superfamily antitoxin RatB of RatAB toxin-antitoxin module